MVEMAESSVPPKEIPEAQGRGPGWCSLCNISCNSIENLMKHRAGRKHISRLEKEDSHKRKPQQTNHNSLMSNDVLISEKEQQAKEGSSHSPVSEEEKQDENIKRRLDKGKCASDLNRYCQNSELSSCLIRETSEKQPVNSHKGYNAESDIWEAYKKKSSLSARSMVQMVEPSIPFQDAKGQEDLSWCSLCKITCNSIENLLMHRAGRKHKRRLEKEASNPEKLQQTNHNTMLTNVLISGKELTDNDTLSTVPVSGEEKHNENTPKRVDEENRVLDLRRCWPNSRLSNCPFTNHNSILCSCDQRRENNSFSSCLTTTMAEPSMPSAEERKRQEKDPGWCSLCNVTCISTVNLMKHIVGRKHKHNLWLKKIALLYKTLINKAGTGKEQEDNNKALSDLTLSGEEKQVQNNLKRVHEEDFAQAFKRQRQIFCSSKAQMKPVFSEKCELCNIYCPCTAILQTHLNGRKHKARLEKLEKDNAYIKGIEGVKDNVAMLSDSTHIS